jgi:hypothetical protein
MRPAATLPTLRMNRSRLLAASVNKRAVGLWSGLIVSLALNTYFLLTQDRLRRERDSAILREDSTVASKLVLDQDLMRVRSELEKLRRMRLPTP